MTTEHTITHPTLQCQLTGTLDESGQVARYRGIRYATISKRWTRSRLVETLSGNVDARSYG
jgi:carboxylesterase type B